MHNAAVLKLLISSFAAQRSETAFVAMLLCLKETPLKLTQTNSENWLGVRESEGDNGLSLAAVSDIICADSQCRGMILICGEHELPIPKKYLPLIESIGK